MSVITPSTDSGTYLPSGLPAPAPAADGLDTEFWDATRRHELVVQRCNACHSFQWGPEWICHNCRSSDVGWERVSGRARIYSWARSWHPIHPALAKAVPYLVVLVELSDAGDVRMMGNLLGDPMQDVVIGRDVQAVFEDHADQGVTLVQWRTVG
jgi:uncharacterized OB-fold protein